jgi:hypothetical protein
MRLQEKGGHEIVFLPTLDPFQEETEREFWRSESLRNFTLALRPEEPQQTERSLAIENNTGDRARFRTRRLKAGLPIITQ